MRIRVPPQLLVFALAAAFAIAVPGLPRQHHGPPPIAAGLEFSTRHGAPGWSERVETLFPIGSSAQTLVSHLEREGFELDQRQERLSGGHVTYASYQWPLNENCIWQLGVIAQSDAAGAVQRTNDEVRIICSDTVMTWAGTSEGSPFR